MAQGAPGREHRAPAESLSELASRLLSDEGLRGELSPEVVAALVSQAWKGNVRELRNVLRRAAMLAGGPIRVEDLRLAPSSAPADRTAPDVDRTYLELEREILARTITRHGGNKRAAAQALGIPKSTLCDKAKRYGIM